MNISITKFFNEANPKDYSASCAEIGQDAGRITWINACNADFIILDDDEKREAFHNFVRGFGAWEDDEIAAWNEVELNALCIQLISGDMREFESFAQGDWREWERLCEAGACSSRLYSDFNGNVYFDI